MIREPVGLYVQLTSEQRKRVLAFDKPVGSGLISLPKAAPSIPAVKRLGAGLSLLIILALSLGLWSGTWMAIASLIRWVLVW